MKAKMCLLEEETSLLNTTQLSYKCIELNVQKQQDFYDRLKYHSRLLNKDGSINHKEIKEYKKYLNT